MIQEEKPKKLAAAVTLGARGGRAGKGFKKVRGDAEYYRELSQKALEAKKLKSTLSR